VPNAGTSAIASRSGSVIVVALWQDVMHGRGASRTVQLVTPPYQAVSRIASALWEAGMRSIELADFVLAAVTISDVRGAACFNARMAMNVEGADAARGLPCKKC
jgi:hypothetical protein